MTVVASTVALALCALSLAATPAVAGQTCGASSGHQICVTVASGTLSGHAIVTVTNVSNNGVMVAKWAPDGGATTNLITKTGPSPTTNDYSFTWPTEKYLNGAGRLRVQLNAGAFIDTTLTLSNLGNDTDFTHSASDWQTALPTSWNAATDPWVAAVGDGPDGSAQADAVAASILASNPATFLFLGDIYEDGTFTENLNHYGVSAMDDPVNATTWGKLTPITQPAIGNHEDAVAWQDYFHQRPLYTSFDFGGVRFLELASTRNALLKGSAQYVFVQNRLATAPGCVVAFLHHPAINGDTLNPQITDIWRLLADGGADLFLNGHVHTMAEYQPLDDTFHASPTAHLRELISGAGGHSIGAPISDPQNRVAWTAMNKAAGVLYLRLNGAASGGNATGISWEYRAVNGSVLRSNSTSCSPPPVPAVTSMVPASGGSGDAVTLSGSAFLTATSVTVGGIDASFAASSDTSLTLTVPPGSFGGSICVTNFAGAGGCSGDPFSVNEVQRIGTIGAVTTGSTAQPTLSVEVGASGVPAGTTVVLGVAALGGVTVSATDDVGNVYHLDASRPYTGTAPCTSALLSAKIGTPLTAGQHISVTVSSGKAWGFVADQWSGLAGTPDRTGAADSAGVASSTVSVTTDGPTSQADEAAVAATCIGAQPGMTAGPGYTLTTDLPIATASNKRELGIEVDHLETSGAPTAIFQLGSARNWAASIATYPAEPPPPPTPTVTDVTPGSGQVGDQVTISGTDLTGATVVTFNATAATAFNVDSNTSITATVPTGANTGKVCVTTPGGTGCTVNDFTVTAPVVPSRVGAIGATSNTTGATLNTLSLQVGADGVPVGDTVVMAISAQGVVDITNVADAEGNTYHVDVARPYGGTAACTSAIVSARLSTALSAGDTISVTVSSGKSWGFSADRWTGISGGVDATGSADSGSTTGSAVAVSTTAATSAAHEGVIGVTCIAAQPGFAVGSGYALSRDLLMTYKETRREMGVEYAVVSAVGIQTATLQLDASRNWSAVVATYA